ncbi:MAG: phosphatidate cytidylyltransferase [Lentisphaeria bacterium]|nr:phosphatidate cytidylyltransferase [Lentisphaeria bacterium]
MFKYRAISFPLLLAFFAAMIFWQPWGRYLFLAAGTGALFLLGLEFFAMLESLHLPSYRKTGAFLLAAGFFVVNTMNGMLFASGGHVWNSIRIAAASWGALLLLLVPFIGWFLLLFVKDKQSLLKKLPVTLGGVILLFITFLPLVTTFGTFWRYAYIGNGNFLFLVLVTKSMDTGGYIFGLLSNKILPGGNHKIVPSISPKKSWEGFFGGIAFSVGVALLLWKFNLQPFTMGIWMTVISGVVLALGSFAGDLTESALKRAAGIKDSANIIPGMGGVFDVLDSFIYNGMLFSVLWFVSKMNMQ